MIKKACEHEFFWYAATNEDGWKCCSCDYKPGEPPGFSPSLDREMISTKVDCILHDLHDAGFVHVSNGSEGDGIANHISKICERKQTFDSYSILRLIMDVMTPSHAKYWKRISRGVLNGNDKRDRCPCGALSRSAHGQNGKWEYRCANHSFDEPPSTIGSELK